MPYVKSPNEMGHSPAEMGHSPMQNHHYGKRKPSAMKMESNKQEKYNLMHDMPLDKDASGGRSWMSKHSKSAFQMGHSPAEMGHDSPAKNTETPAERRARKKKEIEESNRKLAEFKRKRAEEKANAKPAPKPEKLSGFGKLARAIKNQFGDNDPRN